METSWGPKPAGGADILAVGFGTTVVMWAVGYFCHLPGVVVPAPVFLVLLLACMAGGGFIAGRYTPRGWKGGMYVGLVSAVLNWLILGSLLSGDHPNRIVPSALWWLPGSLLAAAVLGAGSATVGRLVACRSATPPNWTAVLADGSPGGSPSRTPASETHWMTVFAGIAAGATLLLLAVGGLVTSHEAGLAVVDWPNSYGYNMFLYPLSRMTGGIYYEHAHRLIGALVGLTTVALTVHLQRVEGRRWVRRLAWVALLMVIVQGLLGGLRVTGRLTLSTSPEDTRPSLALAIVHGVLGQVFFGTLVGLVVFTSSGWRTAGPAGRRASAATDRTLTIALVVLVLMQLVFGALVRHVSWGLHLHLTVAGFVALAGFAVGVRAWGLNPDQPILLRLGRTLIVLLAVQLLLGTSALIVVDLTQGLQPRPRADVVLTTAHQVCGALLLACGVTLMLWTHRRHPAHTSDGPV